ncbi:MAG: hypothetical protein DRG09_02410, partial [Epsilonproteobacteria bacterium]
MKIVWDRIWYTLLMLIALSVIVVFFLLNSTKTIEWVANTYAPQYGFGYKKISGGLLTGLEVEALTFKNATLVDSLKLGWNPASLLYNKISITHLHANGLNVEKIKKVVDTFASTDEKKEDNSTLILPVTIGLGEFNVTVKPFDESGIGFQHIALAGEGIVYYGEGINIDDLSLVIDTNVTNIQLRGMIEEKKIRIKKLSIVDIDTIAFEDVIKKMIAIKIDDAIVEKVEPEIEEYKAGKDNFIPQSVRVDSVVLTLKPATYPQVRLERGEVNIKELDVDIYGMIDLHPDTIQLSDLYVLMESNLFKLSTNGNLENEKITVESLSLEDIDTMALKKFLVSLENNQTSTVESAEPKVAQTNSPNTLLPKLLYIKHMDSSIKGVTYDPLLIQSAEVNATNVMLDIGTLTAETGNVDVAVVSSFASFVQHGVIKDNHIISQGDITAHKALFETYGLPLKEDAFDTIPLTMHTDEKQIIIDMEFKGKEILQVHDGEFNVEDISLNNHITYLIPKGKLIVENEGNISIPYAKDIHLTNLLTLEDGLLDYKGKVRLGNLEGIDTNYTKALNDLTVTYHGNAKSIEGLIDSDNVEGKFISTDFKKGDLTISTKQALMIKEMFSLPTELQTSQAEVDIHVPLDFANFTPLHAKAKITSNLANVDADLLYDEKLKIITRTIVPQKSLLRAYNKALNFDTLSPLRTDILLAENKVHVDVTSNGFTSKVNFNSDNKNLEGDLILGAAKFVFKGNVEKKITLDKNIPSLQSLLHQINTMYAFEVPPLDGDAKVSIVLTEMRDLELKLNSHTLTYEVDKETEHILTDTMISLAFVDSALTLNKYHTTFQGQKVFATKASQINVKEGNVDVSPLWINDELKVTGKYDIENKKGEILGYADPLVVSHEMTDLLSRINIKSNIEGNNTTIDGTITIMGGNVYYDMDKKSFSRDKDIIIVQEIEKKKPSPFMDNLATSIKVNTESPLLYKTDEADIKAKTELLIKKEANGPISVLGIIEILKGSSYKIENKKFVFKKSIIEFTGDPTEPMLNISAGYNTVKAEINIQIAGSLTAPEIVLSSIPYMSKDEILTSILFNPAANASEYSEEEKQTMTDGNVVKSILSNAGETVVNTVFSTLGINIDALPFIGKSNDINKTKKAFFTFFSKEDKNGIPSHEIKFTGQEHVKESHLQKAMAVDTKSIVQFWKKDKPKIKDKLLPALEESLRNYYISEGFYDAEFSIKTSKTNVAVKIDENKPIKIREIKISSDHDIADLITFKKNDIFKAKAFSSIKRTIGQRLLNDGYCSYVLDSKAYVDIDKYEVKIKYTLNKGDVCTFGKVTVKGLKTIDDSVVLSRVRIREGERFSLKRIKESYDALYGLGAFDFVSVKYDKNLHNVIPIEIEGREISRPWYFKGGLNFNTETGFSVSADAVRTNFRGNAKQIGLHLGYSSIYKVAEVSYFVPAKFNFLDHYIDLTSKIGYSHFTYTGFKEEKVYAEASLDYNDEKLSLKAGIALEHIDLSSNNKDKFTPIHTLSLGNYLLTGPFLEFSYDARDSKLHPKNGYYVAGKAEYALPYNNDASS